MTARTSFHRPVSLSKTAVLLPIAAAVAVGCETSSAPPPQNPTRLGAENEPEFEIGDFSPLEQAETGPSLPMLTLAAVPDADSNEDTACFAPVKNPSTWKTESARVKGLIREQDAAVKVALLTWLGKILLPESDDLFTDPAVWQIEIATPVVRHVFPSEIKLADASTCIDDVTRNFPAGSKTVTTAFGAEDITFTSKVPISADKIKALRTAALKSKIRIVPKNAYTPALDTNGKPLLGPKKQKLFNSPDGALISQKQIPPPKLRDVLSFRLVSLKPVFFATGALPGDAWKKTTSPESCDVYLVFYDAVPQMPKCPGLKAAGFGAAPSKTPGHVRIRIAGHTETVETEVPFGNVAPITVDGRTRIWLTASPVEEGARLHVDVLNLDTHDNTPIITFTTNNKIISPSNSAKNKKK